MGHKRLSQRIQDAKRAEDEYKGVEIQMEMTRTRKDLWNIYVQLRLNKMIGVIERWVREEKLIIYSSIFILLCMFFFFSF
jgi:hypothetical protein